MASLPSTSSGTVKAITPKRQAAGLKATAKPTSSEKKPAKAPPKTEASVNRLLKMAGYEKPERLSKCVRAGLIRGHFGFQFTGEAGQLDRIVLEGKCSEIGAGPPCSGTLKATVRELLEQPDYAGLDYADGSRNAKIVCDTCKENRSYVTFCCVKDKMRWDDGKATNHCTNCKGLGKCVGDYRNEHCPRCNSHFFAGMSGNFPCNKCSKRRKTGGFDMFGFF